MTDHPRSARSAIHDWQMKGVPRGYRAEWDEPHATPAADVVYARLRVFDPAWLRDLVRRMEDEPWPIVYGQHWTAVAKPPYLREENRITR